MNTTRAKGKANAPTGKSRIRRATAIMTLAVVLAIPGFASGEIASTNARDWFNGANFLSGPIIEILEQDNAAVMHGKEWAVGWTLVSSSDLPIKVTFTKPAVVQPPVDDVPLEYPCAIDDFSIENVGAGSLSSMDGGESYWLWPKVWLQADTSDVVEDDDPTLTTHRVSSANKLVVQVSGRAGIAESTEWEPFDCDITYPFLAADAVSAVNEILEGVVHVFPLTEVVVPIGTFTISNGGEKIVKTPSPANVGEITVTSLTPTFNVSAKVSVTYDGGSNSWTSETDFSKVFWNIEGSSNVPKLKSAEAKEFASAKVELGDGVRQDYCATAQLYDEDKWYSHGPWAGDDKIAEEQICAKVRYVQSNAFTLGGISPECDEVANGIAGGTFPTHLQAIACALSVVDLEAPMSAPPETHHGFVAVPMDSSTIFLVPTEG